MLSEKDKAGYKQIIRLDKKMNNSKSCKILLKTLDRVYEEYSNTGDSYSSLESSEKILTNQ